MSQIDLKTNETEALRSLTAASREYEKALMANDAESLIGLFWDSPHTVRYDPTSHLYGSEDIAEFRRNRPSKNLARQVVKEAIFTLGEDVGVVNIEFERTVEGKVKRGRQSQFWIRFPDVGWKVVSAHVSFKGVSSGCGREHG